MAIECTDMSKIKNKPLAVAALNSGSLSEQSKARILAALSAEPKQSKPSSKHHQPRKGIKNEMAR